MGEEDEQSVFVNECEPNQDRGKSQRKALVQTNQTILKMRNNNPQKNPIRIPESFETNGEGF